jgi:hypothetical protein
MVYVFNPVIERSSRRFLSGLNERLIAKNVLNNFIFHTHRV